MADSFQQRIELQGVEDILAKLKAMGAEGTAAFSKLKQSVDTANPALNNLSKASQQTQEQIKSLGIAFSQAASTIAPFAGSLGSLISVLGAFAGPAGILAAVTGLTLFVKSAADSIVMIDRQAKALGLTNEQLLALSKVAKAAGLSTDELTTALTRMSREVAGAAHEQFQGLIELAKQLSTQLPGSNTKIINVKDAFADLNKLKAAIAEVAPQLREAFRDSGDIARANLPLEQFVQTITKTATKTDEAGLAMRKMIENATNMSTALTNFEKMQELVKKNEAGIKSLGVSFLDAKGKEVGTFEALLRLSDALNKLPDGFQKTAIAAKLAGRGIGPELFEALSLGRKGIVEIQEALKNQGGALDAEGIQKAKDLRKAFLDLDSSTKKFSNTLVTTFGPVVSGFINELTNSIKDLRDESEKTANVDFGAVIQSIRSTFRNLAEDAGTVWERISKGAEDAGQFILRAFDFQSIRSTFRNLGEDLSTAWNNVVIAARNAANFIGSAFNNALQAVRSAFSNLSQALGGAFNSIVSAVGTVASSIVLAFSNSFQSIRSTFTNLAGTANSIWTGIVAAAQNALQSISGIFASAFQSIRSTFSGLGAALDSVWTSITSAAQGAVSAIVSTFANIGGSIGQAFETVKQLAVQAFEGLKQSAVESLQSIAAGAGAALSGLVDALVAPFRSAVSVIIALWDSVIAKIRSALSASSQAGAAAPAEGAAPGLARGGFVWGPGTATSDSIIARLSRGEFIINARAVAHFGRDFFAALNAMRSPRSVRVSVVPRFSLGGLVDGMQASLSSLMLPGFAQGGFVDASPASARSLHPVTLHFSNFSGSISGLRESSDVVDKLRRASVTAQVARGGTKPGWYR